MEYRDQVAVITGAGSGVGRAISLALARQGAFVCMVERRREALEAVAAEGGCTGAQMLALPADLTDDATIDQLQAWVAAEVGRVDLLVHCAGRISLGALEDAPASELDEQYRINTRAPYVLTQALLPMLLHQQGQLVFMNSSVGLSARGGIGAYAASKHALRALADSLRDEINGRGVRVLSVYLGRTATPMQAQVHALEGKEFCPEQLIQPEDVATAVLALLSLPRTVEVTDITLRPMRKPTARPALSASGKVYSRAESCTVQPSPFA